MNDFPNQTTQDPMTAQQYSSECDSDHDMQTPRNKGTTLVVPQISKEQPGFSPRETPKAHK